MSIYFRSVMLFVVAACTTKSEATKEDTTAALPVVSADTAVPAQPPPNGAVRVLFFGTSLTAGYGLDPSIAFPRLIEEKSRESDTPIDAINAGLSGETSAGAVRRIEWALRNPVDVVVIETGGNDALRALDPDSLETNLEAIVTRAKKAQPRAKILLVQMESPPNLGAAYNARFRAAYGKVASRENVTLLPFLLDRVAGKDDLNQSDGVHPNEKGERIVADNVWRAIKPAVEAASRKRAN